MPHGILRYATHLLDALAPSVHASSIAACDTWQVLHGMRGVKMAAWEKPLSVKLERLRQAEISKVRVAAQLKGATLSFGFINVSTSTFASVVCYVAQGGVLTPTTVRTIC